MAEITIKDIAKMCGCSVSTVSRALNNHPDINANTKDRIQKVIDETGFVPNNSARYLKRNESNSIAVLVKGITNPFFTGLIDVFEDYSQKAGYGMILRHIDEAENEVERALRLVKERKPKGLIFLGGAFEHDEKMLEMLETPFVFCTVGMDPNRPITTYSSVAVDDFKASYDAVTYLIEKGHKKIAMICDGINVPSIGQLRYRGYVKALVEHGLDLDPELVYEIHNGKMHISMENGYKAALELMGRTCKFSAIFCIADTLAIGAYRAVMESGRRIPEDISIMGYDGITMGEYVFPKLTTVSQPIEEMAKTTIKLLFDLIDETTDVKTIIMDAQIEEKESVRSMN